MEKKTALYDQHVTLGARIVPFAGYLMPLEYSGIVDEHRAVREEAGLFDLSHMGELRVEGEEAVEAVDYLVTNDIRGLDVYQIRYTPMCYPDGGIVDDLLVYRFADHLMLVVNASNIDKDLAWIVDHPAGDARIENVSDDVALIAIQGPKAEGILAQVTEIDLESIEYYWFTSGDVAGVDATVSRTGYTGEDGFELYVSPAGAPEVWQALLHAGQSSGLKPVGLGARDTLRLEAGYMLYGNDIDQGTSPLEAGLGWTVRFGASDFIAREVLEAQKANGAERRMVALEMQDRRIPRPHCAVFSGSDRIGELTSGTFSPTFKRGIALGYLASSHARPGTEVEVEIRDQRHAARVVRKPIYKR
ncbi:MAG: glycine cleavage system aminomethyltransferase GcvT [Chloroflexota bacterium]|nr:MAG: glycine cleavage system aminomethyltransferase GcvT [Chloroflexota bacterium]